MTPWQTPDKSAPAPQGKHGKRHAQRTPLLLAAYNPHMTDYTVTTENKVVGPEGTIYDEGDKAVADKLAAFLNSKYEFEQALEAVLDKHDYPLSGAEWQQMLERIAIRGEQG